MNIAFDATAILGPMSKNRGIGNYSISQFREMIAQDTENHYFFFNYFERYSLGNYPNLTEEFFESGEGEVLLRRNNGVILGALLRSFLEKNNIDVFYITSPFDDYIPAYRKEWFDGVRTVATVYDIIPYLYKEKYLSNSSAMKRYMDRVSMLRWVDKILVISQSVKDDLIEYLNFSGENIDVIWGAPGEQFHRVELENKKKKAIREKYRLMEHFIMCTGGDDERKNIAGLIEAYGRLPKSLREQYGLAVVCKLSKASISRYQEIARQNGVEKELVLTGFVPDEELVLLYNLCSLMAFPSKYEGFGLPVTEAWACGKPVLTGDNSSLCQIAGDAATLVNTDDIGDIARGLEKALQETTLATMTQKGEERLKLFQWPLVAERALRSVHQLEIKAETKIGTPRLAFFTPLPPIQSGISDYSVDILSRLANHFDIDVYIDDGYVAECALPDSVHVLNHQRFIENADQYDYILYQMGNSMFHTYMYPYLKRFGGVLVLHDYNMHGVAQHFCLRIKQDNFWTYENYLREDLPGLQVRKILRTCRQGKVPDASIELNGFVTNYADKIIVHSRFAMEKLLRKNIGRTVKYIPHYARIEALPDFRRAKEELQLAPQQIVFAAFGHIAGTKRAIPLLKAAIRFLMSNPEGVFYFVGQLSPDIEEQFLRELDNSSVADRIRVSGYTSLEDFNRYIDATDVCFNLRHPYKGENSGSLARVLAKGKCAVVNNIGSFSEIPDECCVKLPPVTDMKPGEEENLIYQTMKHLAETPEMVLEYGKKAREYAEKTLDLRIVGEQYTDFIRSPHGNTINEEVLRELHTNELKRKDYSEETIHGIAKTLAYCVEQ